MRLHRGVETLGLAAFAALWTALAWRAQADWTSLLLIPAGLLLADLISGIVHFLADTYGSPETPYVGPAFIRPFRQHHSEPTDITRHDFVELNGNSALAALPALIAGFWLPTFVLPGLLALTGAILVTNSIHRWAHLERPPRWVARLQRLRLILSREHHGVHHAPPHASHYSIFAGWTSGLLDAIVSILRPSARPASESAPRI